MINQTKNIYILSLLYMLLFTFMGGFADASSFIIFGIFTGHITGNIILSIFHCVYGDTYLVVKSIIALIGFITGTVIGVWFRLNGKIKYTYNTTIALFVQLVIVIGIFVLKLSIQTTTSEVIFLIGLSFSLGLQNGTINTIKQIGVHSSYITGMTTLFINQCLALNKDHPNYKKNKQEILILFCILLSFVFGAFAGIICTYFIHILGIIMLCILLLITIFLSIYLQRRSVISE